MNKVVFKDMPKEMAGCNVLAKYCGPLSKGAAIINKNDNYMLTIMQGREVLGAIKGKGKVKIGSKSYPNIAYNKKEKRFDDMCIVASKKTYDTFKMSAICEKVTGFEKIKDPDHRVIVESIFDTVGNYSMVALFKPSVIDINQAVFQHDIKKGEDISIIGSENMYKLLHLYVNNFIRDNGLSISIDDFVTAVKIEKITDIASKKSLLFIKALEGYIEEKMESNFGIIGKCTIIGIKDNLLAYI